MIVLELYHELLAKYGPQGWWPRHKGRKRSGFDPRFEVIVGAILTQNTAWKNVEKAVECLFERNLLDPKIMATAPIGLLEASIRSAGYFRQKAKKLKIIARFFSPKTQRSPKFLGNKKLKNKPIGRVSRLSDCLKPNREELLNLWGIGRETADSILLYAFDEPVFVVDVYTRRLLATCGQKKLAKADYDKIRKCFEDQLPRDAKLFNEFHALIVADGKKDKERKRQRAKT